MISASAPAATPSEILARFCLTLAPHEIPDDVASAAKAHLLDALGVALAASSLEPGRRLERSLRHAAADGESTAIGFTRPMPAAYAALLNGTLTHSLEYDDTHTASIIHGSSLVMPTVLAAAERERRSGADALAAFVAGWEVLVRLGASAPGAFQARGFQTTAVCGPFVAAAVASRLYGSAFDAAVNAVGIAGSQASGVFAFLADGSTVKALHPGWAAHAGLIAAQLALGGMTGPRDIFEDRFGLYPVYSGTSGAPLREQLATLGSEWEIVRASVKLFPCCHFIHPFLECVAALVRDHGLAAADIASVECLVPVEEAPIICDPWERRVAPMSGYEAKFSLPYCVAALVVDGRVDVDTFATTALSARALEFARRVRHTPLERSGYPQRYPGHVRLTVRDGVVLETSVPDVLGGPARPVSAGRVIDKFVANATRRISGEAAQRVVEGVMALETLPGLDSLVRELHSTPLG